MASPGQSRPTAEHGPCVPHAPLQHVEASRSTRSVRPQCTAIRCAENPTVAWITQCVGASPEQMVSTTQNATLQRAGACPVKHDDNASTKQPGSSTANSGCPVNPRNVMPLQSAHDSAVNVDAALSTDRAASTIPVAQPESLPEHQRVSQEGGSTTWLYPSEKMFYAAMKRKVGPADLLHTIVALMGGSHEPHITTRLVAPMVGSKVPVRWLVEQCGFHSTVKVQGWTPASEDMKWVVDIHNIVNERAWQHILQWEQLHSGECTCPKLKRFQGRPKDYSPRARMLNFFGYTLPFDRHDWYVDRCGQEVRYVIDFYSADATKQSAPAAMFLDVRPALDSFGACVDRARMSIINMLSSW